MDDHNFNTFPPQLIDEFFTEIHPRIHRHLILSWAKIFAENQDKQQLIDDGITSIISTITKLNFSHYIGVNESILNIAHLPLTNLAELTFAETPLGSNPVLPTILSAPILQNLVKLNLYATSLTGDPLFDVPHNFPRMRWLVISHNWDPQTITKFPVLVDLGLVGISLNHLTLKAFDPPQQPSQNGATKDENNITPLSPVLPQLHSLLIRPSERAPYPPPRGTDLNMVKLSRSPFLKELRELSIHDVLTSPRSLELMFTQSKKAKKCSVLENLTFLGLSGSMMKTRNALNEIGAIIGYSPLLSNLQTLELDGNRTTSDPFCLFQLITKSPYLTRNLKHLTLTRFQMIPSPYNFSSALSSGMRLGMMLENLESMGVCLETLNLNGSAFDLQHHQLEPGQFNDYRNTCSTTGTANAKSNGIALGTLLATSPVLQKLKVLKMDGCLFYLDLNAHEIHDYSRTRDLTIARVTNEWTNVVGALSRARALSSDGSGGSGGGGVVKQNCLSNLTTLILNPRIGHYRVNIQLHSDTIKSLLVSELLSDNLKELSFGPLVDKGGGDVIAKALANTTQSTSSQNDHHQITPSSTPLKFAQLESLSLSCTGLGHDGLNDIIHHLPRLSTLDISQNPDLFKPFKPFPSPQIPITPSTPPPTTTTGIALLHNHEDPSSPTTIISPPLPNLKSLTISPHIPTPRFIAAGDTIPTMDDIDWEPGSEQRSKLTSSQLVQNLEHYIDTIDQQESHWTPSRHWTERCNRRWEP